MNNLIITLMTEYEKLSILIQDINRVFIKQYLMNTKLVINQGIHSEETGIVSIRINLQHEDKIYFITDYSSAITNNIETAREYIYEKLYLRLSDNLIFAKGEFKISKLINGNFPNSAIKCST